MREIKKVKNEMNYPVTLQEIAVTLSNAEGVSHFTNVGIVIEQVTEHTDNEGTFVLELNREQAMQLAEYLIEYSGGTLAGESESGK